LPDPNARVEGATAILAFEVDAGLCRGTLRVDHTEGFGATGEEEQQGHREDDRGD
jgi:hypothetical protein